MNNHYLYLVINLAVLILPLVFSFEKRLNYYRQWRWLFPSLIITTSVFIFWDRYFTIAGIWGFNPEYLTGYQVFNLPVEEVLFFFTIPFSSLFIYTFLNTLFPASDRFNKYANYISLLIIIISVLGVIFCHNRSYTLLNCIYASILLGSQLLFIRGNYLGRFYRFYCWHLIPFFIVNGILTGTGIAGEVVWYNPLAIIGARILTIPVEDLLFSMSLMLMNITIFEFLRARVNQRSASLSI